MANDNTLAIASDHAGVALRVALADHARSLGWSVRDLGPLDDAASVDYPDYAGRVCSAMRGDANARGVLVCGSGIGMAIAANRFPWVRAVVLTSKEAAVLSRQHNDANVACFGQRLIEQEQAKDLLHMFLEEGFAGGRHQARVNKLTGESKSYE